MYFKLALKNVRKSFKDFLIYFLTLAFSVCLFYTFNSFQAQQAVMEMSQTQLEIIEMLTMLMTILSVFVAIVLAFLILYANNFLIKRRKKELGIYTLLGMPKRKISKILVYETFVIGLTSLVIGMLLGLLLSQILTAVSASLFDVTLNYRFVFSPSATIVTLLAFGGIFLLTMLFNTFVLNRYKLIDLIHADRKNDELKIKKVWVSIIVFIISLVCLGGAYYFSMKDAFTAFMNLLPIIIAGSVGTVLFFLSLAGFLLTVIKSSKKVYFKNLNCFILRQINSNINSNFISMSIVCIMLLLSIGALSTGLSLNSTINLALRNSTPYDITYTAFQYNQYANEKPVNMPDNTGELLANLPIDKSLIKSEFLTKKYKSDVNFKDPAIMDCLSDNYKSMIYEEGDVSIPVFSLSSYNQELKARDYDTIKLSDNEVYLFSNSEMLADGVQSILDAKPTIQLFGHDLKISNDDYMAIPIGTTTSVNTETLALVVKDEFIPEDTQVLNYYWSANHVDSISDAAFAEELRNALFQINESLPEEQFLQTIDFFYPTKDEVYINSKGLSVVFTYIGIYLGIVFMIASAVILALQQLSQASDNKKRYMILTKIGTDKRMMNRSILMQIAIYFMLPLLLALVHSYVGIHVVNVMVMSFGKTDIMMSSLTTAGVIIAIYGSYFLVTYMGYKNIIKS
ncbi:FtsX-like permease family protein [Amedibacillus sp. YH-ame10]